MRFAHIADIHIGYPIYGLGEKIVGKRDDLWDELDRAIDYLELNPVEYLFITGDLFDYVPDENDLHKVDTMFARLKNTSIIYITGEKDCCRDNAAIFSYAFISNMYVLNGRHFKNVVPSGKKAKRVDDKNPNPIVDHIRFENDNLEIYGVCQYNYFNERTDFDSVYVSNPNAINVLLCHGGEDNVSPFEPEDFSTGAFDYIGVGHKHNYTEYVDKKIYFPGSLLCLEESARFERHGFIRGHLYKGELKIKYIASTTEYNVYENDTIPRDTVKSKDTLLEERDKYKEAIKNCDEGIKNYEKVRDQYTDYTGEYNKVNEKKKKLEYELNIIQHEDLWVDKKYDMRRLRAMLIAALPTTIAFFIVLINIGMKPSIYEKYLVVLVVATVILAAGTYKLYNSTVELRYNLYGALYPALAHMNNDENIKYLNSEITLLIKELEELKEKNKPIDSINYKIGELRRSRKIAVKKLNIVEEKLNRMS